MSAPAKPAPSANGGTSAAAAASPAWTCPTCDRAATDAFCSACGERRPSPHGMSVRHLAAELAGHLSTLDTKLVRTVALLFARPGALLVEYRRGARARYASPLQLFLWTNVAFFVVVPTLGIFDYRWRTTPDVARLGAGWYGDLLRHKLHAAGSPEALRLAFNASVGGRMQTLFAVVVPALACTLVVLHPRRRVMEHVLMAIFLAPVFMAVLIGTFAIIDGVSLFDPPGAFMRVAGYGLLCLAFALFGAHAALALRRAYGDGWPAALARGAVLGAAAVNFPAVYFWLVTRVTVLLL